MVSACMQFIYYIAGNFSQIDGKYNFHRENGLLAFATPKDATPPNFAKLQCQVRKKKVLRN